MRAFRPWFLSVALGIAAGILGFALVRTMARPPSEMAWPSDTLCPKIGLEPAGKWSCYRPSDRKYLNLHTGAWDDCLSNGVDPVPRWCPKIVTITLGAPEVQSVETDDAGVTRIRFEAPTTRTDNR